LIFFAALALFLFVMVEIFQLSPFSEVWRPPTETFSFEDDRRFPWSTIGAALPTLFFFWGRVTFFFVVGFFSKIRSALPPSCARPPFLLATPLSVENAARTPSSLFSFFH